MAKVPQPMRDNADGVLQHIFAASLGALLGLSLLKFGNPVLMDKQVVTPANAYEWMLDAWPLAVGQGLFILVTLLGLFVIRPRPDAPRWLVLAPLPWLAWQFIATTGSVDMQRSLPTLVHFVTNVACFYLGLFCLSPVRRMKWFWTCLITGFVLVLLSGWQQHFGGLEATRQYFFEEVYPHHKDEIPAALLKRMSSNRIFATLFYPNTLAGAILLLAPVSVGVFPGIARRGSVRRVGLMLTLILAAGCLVWSGSKGGWLLMLGLLLIALFRLRFSRLLKVALAVGLLAAGTAGFFWKYSTYFRKGAQSAVARLDYWEAAVQLTATHPIRGTGPGTFGKMYEQVKRPESEMAQMAHNDYLEQACDSGLPGFVFYAGFIGAAMWHLWRRTWRSPNASHFWIWLGLLGINAQSLTEFGFYIPAIAWPGMVLLGWLTGGVRNDLDIPRRPNQSSGPV